jgi:hypothetical protein
LRQLRLTPSPPWTELLCAFRLEAFPHADLEFFVFRDPLFDFLRHQIGLRRGRLEPSAVTDHLARALVAHVANNPGSGGTLLIHASACAAESAWSSYFEPGNVVTSLR